MTKQAQLPSAGIPLPTLSNWLRRVMVIDPAATALTFAESSFPWSYLADVTADLERLLGDLPAARRIGLVLRNRPAQLAALLAVIATGRQVVTLSPHVGDEGLGDDIRSLQPDVVIADEQDWARAPVRAAAADTRAVPLLVTQDAGLEPLPVSWIPRPAGLPTDDIAVVMMTSGTTGRPKRVSLSYTQLTAAFDAAGTVLDDNAGPRLRNGYVILWSSLAHISGLYFAIAHAADGRSVALMERFQVDEWARLVRTHRPRQLRLPPTAIRMVLRAELPPDTFSSVRAVGSGTAPLPPDLAEEFEQRYGVPVLTTYGATEFAGAIAGWSVADHRRWAGTKRGSVGRAHRGIELRIVDRTTHEVKAPGDTGLLEVRGPQLPSAGEEWLRTNDVASLDEDGFLFIHGRADDAINRGGFKIPPSVIEDALHQHPAVSDATAVGLPDERLGQVPVAAVTLCGQASEQDLLDHLAARLTRYQMPVHLRILDTLPRTPSLKVDRPALQEIFTGEQAAYEHPSSNLGETR
ncbi:class I adenylate-forming enzyme family protein [Streptomyces sp. NPDC001443]